MWLRRPYHSIFTRFTHKERATRNSVTRVKPGTRELLRLVQSRLIPASPGAAASAPLKHVFSYIIPSRSLFEAGMYG